MDAAQQQPADEGVHAAVGSGGTMDGDSDVLIVPCPSGYTWLFHKMALAYRTILARFDVEFFIRADVDSVLPLPLLLPLLPLAANAQAILGLCSIKGALLGADA